MSDKFDDPEYQERVVEMAQRIRNDEKAGRVNAAYWQLREMVIADLKRDPEFKDLPPDDFDCTVYVKLAWIRIEAHDRRDASVTGTKH